MSDAKAAAAFLGVEQSATGRRWVGPGIEINRQAEALAQAGTSRKTALVVTMTVTAHGPDVAVANGKPLDGPLRQGLAGIAAEHGFSRLTWDGETVVTRLPPEQQFDGISVIPPAGAFLQATPVGARAIIVFSERLDFSTASDWISKKATTSYWSLFPKPLAAGRSPEPWLTGAA